MLRRHLLVCWYFRLYYEIRLIYGILNVVTGIIVGMDSNTL